MPAVVLGISREGLVPCHPLPLCTWANTGFVLLGLVVSSVLPTGCGGVWGIKRKHGWLVMWGSGECVWGPRGGGGRTEGIGSVGISGVWRVRSALDVFV